MSTSEEGDSLTAVVPGSDDVPPVSPPPLSLHASLNDARSTITELRGKLEERCRQVDKEIALRKLLHHQQKDTEGKLREVQQHLDATLYENTQLKSKIASSKSEPSRGTSASSPLKELEVVKDENKQLRSTLTQAESELQTLRLTQARMETANSASIAAQNAALMERLGSVQREREHALTVQLRATMEEKEEAVQRMREMEERNGLKFQVDQNLPVDKSLQTLVDSLRSAQNTQELKDRGVALVGQVKALKEANRLNIAEKIQLLTQERDAALGKKHGLENEISRLQRHLEMMETEYKLVDRTRIKALQAQLQAAINEKEAWQQKAAKFEDTCETLRVLSCLQRSLSKEDDIKRRYELELQRCHADKAALTDQLDRTLQERNHVVQERNLVIQERNALALQAQQEYERAERFHRLVIVLRKKAMSGGVVPPSPSHSEESQDLVYTHSQK